MSHHMAGSEGTLTYFKSVHVHEQRQSDVSLKLMLLQAAGRCPQHSKLLANYSVPCRFLCSGNVCQFKNPRTDQRQVMLTLQLVQALLTYDLVMMWRHNGQRAWSGIDTT